MKNLFIALGFILSFFLSSCSSDNDSDYTAGRNKQYPVSLSIDINSKDDIDLMFNPNCKIIDEARVSTDKLGYEGIILYYNEKTSGLETTNLLRAFDSACPNCWDGTVLVKRSTPTPDYDCPKCSLTLNSRMGICGLTDKDGYITEIKNTVEYSVERVGKKSFTVSNPK